MKIISLYLVTIFLLLSFGQFYASAQTKGGARIGVILPLTGPVAIVGNAVKNSIILADDKFDKGNNLEFIFEDDAYTPKNTVLAVRKLIAEDMVSGLIVFGSGPALAVNNIAEKAHIPMVAISTATQVTDGFSYVVRHWLDSDVEVAKIYGEVKRRSYESIAIVSASNDALLAIRDEFLSVNKVKISYDQQFDPGDRDFRAAAAKIKSLNPSAVFLLLMPPQSGIFAKQLRSQGYRGDFFASHFLEIDEELQRQGNALVGTWFATSDDSAAGEFRADYRSRFGQDPVAGCTNGYDIAKLFVNGIKTKDLNGYLHDVKKFDGSLGVYGANGKKGFDMAAALKVVTELGIKSLLMVSPKTPSTILPISKSTTN